MKLITPNTGRWMVRHEARVLAALCILSCAVVWLMTGCAAPMIIAHKIVGPPPIPAQYVPPKTPMLVLVENYHNPSATAVEGQRVALRIEEELGRYQVAPIVAADRLETIRADTGYANMTIPAIGRAVGAAQILYVNVRTFSVDRTVGGEMLKGKTELAVRIVDAATGDTRWPTDNPTGYPITTGTAWLREGTDATDASLRDQMANEVADSVVKLFRKHSPEEDEQEPVQ